METLNNKKEERMILVGLNITDYKKNSASTKIEESMQELEELARAAGGIVLGRIVQNKDNYDVAYYVGKGKAEEIKDFAQNMQANLIVFNEELSGAQIRNLEDFIGIDVIDRTALILDIFAKRALSKEGKLQVELAQYRYRLPRLIGLGKEMSKLGGGIGSKGPGEKKLETDKRHIRERIYDIQDEIKDIKKNRETQRSQRLKANLPIVAVVGYTNAGKSTLVNELIKTHKEYTSEKDLFVKDMLFATLDVSLRKAILPSNKEYLITDTVGFVSDLPHYLVEAFKATLEEVSFADILIHVVDASNEHYNLQIDTTLSVLKEIGVGNKPMIYAFNKADKVNFELDYKPLEPYVFISAKTLYNIDKLLDKIQDIMGDTLHKVRLNIPFSNGDIINSLHKKYKFIESYNEMGVEIDLDIDDEDYGRYKDFIDLKEQ